MSNPMESEDLVMTHVFQCSVTLRVYYVTLRGPYYKTERKARELIVEQMLAHAARHPEDPNNEELSASACNYRLRPMHNFELGTVAAVWQQHPGRMLNGQVLRSDAPERTTT
jgi:hypothetical protein